MFLHFLKAHYPWIGFRFLFYKEGKNDLCVQQKQNSTKGVYCGAFYYQVYRGTHDS